MLPSEQIHPGPTQVRAILCGGLSSGPRNDAPDHALSMRQRWRLAELRAEEYAFVLLSQFSNLIAAKVLAPPPQP